MAASTISTVASVLKEVWAQEDVTKQFDEGALLLDIVEHGDQSAPQFVEMLGEYDGKYVIFPLHTAGNPNVGIGVQEGRQYPTEGGQTYSQAKYRCRFVSSVMGLTTQVMTRGRGNPQSIFNVSAKEASAIVANTRRRMNMWMHRDGSGLLATVAAAGNTTTGVITVDNTADIPVGAEIIIRTLVSGGFGTGTLPTGWYATAVTTGEPAYVSAKNSTALTLKKYDTTTNFGAGIDNATNAMGVYFWDSQAYVPFGIDAACDSINQAATGVDQTTTVTATDEGGILVPFGAIDRTVAANSFWKGINNTDHGVTTNLAGAAVSIEEHIQPLIAMINQQDSTLIDEDAIIAVSRQSQWWQVVNQLESGRRTEVRTRIIDGKYEVVRYGPITFAYDPMASSQTMKFFAPRYCFRMVASPWGFEDMSGSEYTQVLGSIQRPTSKWRKNLFSQQQFCASYCGANCKFTSIAA